MAAAARRQTGGSTFTTLIALLLVTSVSGEDDEVPLRDCHSTDPRPYVYHATKTPYELINNEDSSPIFVAGQYIRFVCIVELLFRAYSNDKKLRWTFYAA